MQFAEGAEAQARGADGARLRSGTTTECNGWLVCGGGGGDGGGGGGGGGGGAGGGGGEGKGRTTSVVAPSPGPMSVSAMISERYGTYTPPTTGWTEN